MTSALTVNDRRQAALDRLADKGARPPRTRTKPQRATRTPSRLRAIARTDGDSTVRRERLGAPPGTWYGIIAVVAVFVMLGLVMVLSASAVTQANQGNSPYSVFLRQSMWAGFGLIGLVAMARIPYRMWRKFVVPIGLIGVAAMLGPFAPGIGANVNGANAWIRVAGFSVQPSEFLKLAVVILAADLLTRRQHAMNHRSGTLYPLAGIAAVGAGLCLAQKDLGSAIVLGSIVFAIAWIAGVPFTPLATMGALSTAVGAAFVVSSQARLDRFTAFLDPDGTKDHLGWQMSQAAISIASGGPAGSGIGGSNTKTGYLPYAHSDFIFAIIADELGMIGAGTVIGGFAMLVLFGVQTALAAPDRFGMLLAGGIAAWFGVQAIINLGGVTGVMPVTGLTLPFFSAGGSSLFVSMAAAGLLLSVTRRIGVRGA
jgi:cell division protein FtsW